MRHSLTEYSQVALDLLVLSQACNNELNLLLMHSLTTPFLENCLGIFGQWLCDLLDAGMSCSLSIRVLFSWSPVEALANVLLSDLSSMAIAAEKLHFGAFSLALFIIFSRLLNSSLLHQIEQLLHVWSVPFNFSADFLIQDSDWVDLWHRTYVWLVQIRLWYLLNDLFWVQVCSMLDQFLDARLVVIHNHLFDLAFLSFIILRLDLYLHSERWIFLIILDFIFRLMLCDHIIPPDEVSS